MRRQVTALPPYGGILFPFAIGAVVDGEPTTSQTPDSGHVSPVRAVVPNGALLAMSGCKPMRAYTARKMSQESFRLLWEQGFQADFGGRFVDLEGVGYVLDCLLPVLLRENG